ncbi:MAG: hypothetical protein C4527_23475 [Candidatus Omnitrophota bacterium]|nr:MAG: hypothetical protein C4527_23475 [Candidatus Omnitrophota bacterium]
MKRLRQIKWRVLFLALVGVLTVWGDFDRPVSAQQAYVPTGVSPLSKRIELLSIPLATYPFIQRGNIRVVPTIRFQEIVEIKVQFEDRTIDQNGNPISGLNISEDFLPLTASALTSGLALFKETSGSKDGFNYTVGDQNSDTPIDLTAPPIVEVDPANPRHFMVTFKPKSGTTRLNTLMDQSADFYIVAQTSLNLRHGDTFEVSIPANGIKIRDVQGALIDDTLFENRFPSREFANEVFPSPSPGVTLSVNELFVNPAVFQGDIVTIVSMISDVDLTNRIDASSEPTTILGFDVIGREDQQYFLREIRVNWIGLNLGAVAKLLAVLTRPDYSGATASGMIAAFGGGILEQLNMYPSFFYSPWFYNFPVDAETGQLLTETRTITLGRESVDITYPMTMPLNNYGIPRETFILGTDSVGENPAHFTSYVSFGPRDPNKDELSPRLVTHDILQNFVADAAGGAFLYRELGGTKGKYDRGVDQIIKLDANRFQIIPFAISPDEVNSATSPLRSILTRLIPGVIGGSGGGSISGKGIGPFLFGDDNLGSALLGVIDMPDPSDSRPPLGSLECYMDPDCLFFDLMINVLRPYLGLTEGQIRYLFEKTEDNGRTNAEELFGFPLVQGFTFVMPVARDNALGNLRVPTSRTGSDAGSEIYLGIRTSDNLRNLDSFIPFVKPQDVVVGTNVNSFTQGLTENVSSLPSVSSIGVARKNTGTTYAMIGRPRPRFQFQDLTQPGEGLLASNNNILLDRSQESPPKAVIGIDAVDMGQNATLTINSDRIEVDTFDTFFTENSVLGDLQIEFLPGTNSLGFQPSMLGVIPITLGVNLPLQRIVSSHSVAIYVDDDTPRGDGFDDDGDGLVDEEYYNLMDDDGDGLIDEDLGDGSPQGINGFFDAMDRYLPFDRDNRGSSNAFEDATYVYTPNDQAKFTDYIDAIQPTDNAVTLVDGQVLPLDFNEGSWFADLDLRALNINNYLIPRNRIYPSSFSRPFDSTAGPPFGSPEYNQGMFSGVDPFTGLVDFVLAMRGGGDFQNFPYYPDDLFIEDPSSGDVIWMITFGDDVPVVPDPDGFPPRTFALTMARAFRIPNPFYGFVRVGNVPMVVNLTDVADGQNPQGDNMWDPPLYTQFGFFIQIAADDNAIADYVSNLVDSLQQAYDSARDTIAQFNEAVADAEAAAAEAEEPTDPEYPDIPDPQEVTFTDPYEAFGFDDFLNTPQYQTNYQYQIQIPDENFGPLAGNDYFVVLRAAPQARIGETFRVRVRSGQRNATLLSVDTGTGESTALVAPEGGVGYHSYIETNFSAGQEAFRNVSKNQITTGEIVIQSRNVPPSIQFISPGAGLNLASSDFEFDISFTATDPDNVAQIQLFTDNDNLDFNGSFIPGAILREGFDTTFTINLLTDIPNFDPTKSYYVYAKIDDGINPPVYTYSAGPISTVASVTDPTTGGGGAGGGVVVTGDLPNPLDYYKLTKDGRIFNLGDAPALGEVSRTNDVIDMALTPTLSGAIVLQIDGKVLGVDDVGVFRTYLQPNGELIFPNEKRAFYNSASSEIITAPADADITIDHARDVEVDFSRGAIYILDGDGDMLFLGEALTHLHPIGIGLDLYRDMKLTPNGDNMYFLSGNGILSTAGGDSVSGWTGLVAGDIYRDMSLITSGATVTHIVITDADGNLTVVGSNDSIASYIRSLRPTDPITPGSIRLVKLFPGDTSMVMLVEGSGRIHLLARTQPLMPTDGLVFADSTALDDDTVVDVQTTSINLQSIVETVRNILAGIQNENIDQVMAYVSADYKDRSGANAQGLRKSLMSFFTFYEVETFAESTLNANSFTITSQGDSLNAQVMVDMSVFWPTISYIIPDVDTSSLYGETFGQMLFQQRIPFDQTLRIREVSDGRGWSVNLYEIRDFGRKIDELVNSQDVEFEDIRYLTQQTANRRLGWYTPRYAGIDPTKSFFLNVNENDPITPYNILAVFQESYLAYETAPPAFEFTLYTGQFIAGMAFDTLDLRFRRNADGTTRLTGMKLRQVISENTQLSQIGGGQQLEECITSLDGQEADTPFGFNFDARGPAPMLCPGAGDVDFGFSGDSLQVNSPAGGIMMLPQNTDIYAINPQQYVQRLNRAIVRLNPYDPANAGAGGGSNDPGFSATAVAGRAYFVIARDGRHYGFIQIPPIQGGQDPLTLTPPILSFDYRYEDSFILPSNF